MVHPDLVSSPRSISNRHIILCRALEADQSAKLRANVVVFYGRLSAHLSPAARARSVLPAFVRALRDPFAPARLAAVRALAAR